MVACTYSIIAVVEDTAGIIHISFTDLEVLLGENGPHIFTWALFQGQPTHLPAFEYRLHLEQVQVYSR